jgi:TonB-linked SusC/RagA family outer membrane protein
MEFKHLIMAFCLIAQVNASANTENTVKTVPDNILKNSSVENTILQQQKRQTQGRVIDEQGNAIIGATVTQKGTTNRTITDMDGYFNLNVPSGSMLMISYIGYEEQEVKASNHINVTMKESYKFLNEVVAVGYGVQKVATVTGSVSQIKTDKITVAPIGNVTNALGGQLPGLITKQESGIPGQDDAALYIRNFGTPLVIIDGIESSLSDLDPNQIESISILKDGAASIYGARAGNGVILVTTKRGIAGKVTVNANVSFSWQGSSHVIKPATSAQRAQYLNDVWIYGGNDPSDAPYTDKEIALYKDGTDPNYLNTDWFDACIRSLAPMENHNVSLSGGTEKLKYYGYFGYDRQETLLKTNGGRYEHMNIMTNMDAKIAPRLTMSLDMKYYKQQRFYPAACDGMSTPENFWQNMIYAADPKYPLSLPDKTKLAYAGMTYGNPIFGTNSDLSGYQNLKKNIIVIRSGLKYESRYITGLDASGYVTYTHTEDGNKTFKKQQPFYTYNANTNEYIFSRNSQDPIRMGMSNNDINRTNLQLSLNYNHTFKEAHTLGIQAIYEYDLLRNSGFNGSREGFKSSILDEFFAGDPMTSNIASSSANVGRISWIGRLNYNYKDRYIFEGILRADASSRYEKGSRWGYFPSVSLGWNVANESFMKPLKMVNLLKLRLSYGESGDDGIANFAYLAGYSYDNSYTFGNTLTTGLLATGLANPDLTWEKMAITNLGIDYALWNRKIYGSFDLFRRHRSGIPGQRSSSMPSTFGANLPLENLNSINTSGFEFSIGTAGSVVNFNYDVSANVSYSRAKWDKYDEPVYTDPDQERLYKKAGSYTDRRIGYVFDGLFTSQEEIKNWDCTYEVLNNNNATLRPGDVKYKDLNGDHVINWRDQKEIGKGSTPHWMCGVNFNLSYKGFDLQGLLQGAWGYTTYVVLDGCETELKYKSMWREDNNDPNAYCPRPGGISSIDWLYSDYRNHNTSYLRLRNIALGYTLPKSFTMKMGVERLRIYVGGTNVFTLSSLNKYGVDPEMSEGHYAGVGYPQQFTFSFGMNLTL